MSGGTPSSYAVLLPAATIAVFSQHRDTHVAVAALAQDWRFARIKFDLRAGDVAQAIHYYSTTPSPNLLIVDTDVIDSSFTALLEQLASTCSEGTDAVVVGPVNDVALYRYLINMGVGDYLVRPLQTPIVADVIARLVLAQLGASDSQLVAVVGAKGGVGISTVAELLAYGLAEVRGQKTMILDAAGARSYLSVAFGLEPVTTLPEMARAAVANDPNALQRMLLKSGKALQVLGTGNDKYFDEGITPEQMEKVLDRILAVTPFVIADLSGATIPLQRTLLARAQRIILVSNATLSSLRLTRTLLAEIKDLKGGVVDLIDLVINMVGLAPGIEMAKTDIETALGHKIVLTIPFDPKMAVAAETHGKPLGLSKGFDKIMADLVARVIPQGRGPDAPKPAGPSGLLDQFMRKVK